MTTRKAIRRKSDEKAKSLTRKGNEKKEERKDTTEESLNHGGFSERLFHPGRWGMSALSPPVEFLKNMLRQTMHRKNKEQTEGEKDRREHVAGRWRMSVTSKGIPRGHRNTSGT
jgi:predicted deacetylase